MTRPNSYPEWASDPLAEKEEPLNIYKQQGFALGDFPDNQNMNWLLNNLYQWIQHFDNQGFFPYETVASMQSKVSTDLSNNTFYSVAEKGIYRYLNSATNPVDNEYVIAPSDNIGRFLLFVPYPTVSDERIKDFLGDIQKMIFVDYTPVTPRVGMSNTNIPMSMNYPLLNRLHWGGDINSFSNSNATGGSFYGMCGSFTNPSATGSNIHLIQIRAMGLDEAGKLVLTGARYTIQTGVTFSSTETASRHVFFVNPINAGVSGSALTGMTIEGNQKLTSYGNLKPATTNTHDIGESSLRYSTIYLQNAPNVASDLRLKKDINPTDVNKFFDLIEELDNRNAFINFKFKNTEYEKEYYKSEIDENGEVIDTLDYTETIEIKGNRGHFGLSAQDLVEAMLEVGIQTNECSLVSIENYKEGDELKVRTDAGTLTVAYPEFVAPMLQMIHNLNKRVKDLEQQLGE
jgi:hypothetical protein